MRVLTCLTLVLGISLAASGVSFSQEDAGEEIFEELRCGNCHQPDVRKSAPSLQSIATTYGEQGKLEKYFSGETEPILEPERAKTMDIRLRKIKKLAQADQQALAGYVMGFKK